VQNAKDTFYEVLRGRLAAINPERTIVLRGVVRPGVLVEENELITTVALPECFRLRWTQAAADPNGALATIALECEIDYETAGNAFNSGMDRGRSLAAMDAELQSTVNATPQSAPKSNYTGLANGAAAVPMSTSIWWGPLVFGKTKITDDRIGRTATVVVNSFQEAGEL
jgi:hypothetical protein